jgi:4-amino-4-deoxy-L-arabinose transferase-like glycosyltransferase
LKETGALEIRDKLLFALIFAGLLLHLVFSPPILHRGEAREGLVVQGIVHNQQWILPFRNGELPSKPPLFHWIAASAAMMFGESDFIMRLPSAIGAGIMVIVTFLLGRAMTGKLAGWLAVGALLGIHDFWYAAAEARVDMIFSACVTAAIAGFYFWYRNGADAARVFCYLATVCAVLAKGPVGIALVGLVIVGFLAVEKRPRSLWTFWSWSWVGAALVIIAGWYGLAYSIGGEKFLALQLGYENIDRFIGGDAFPRHKMYLSMALWLVTQTLPWNLVLLWSALRWLRGTRENSDGRLLHMWWFAMFCFFALAARTRPVYFLPMFPAIALLAARALNALIAHDVATVGTGQALEGSLSPDAAPRSSSLAKWVIVGVLISDLTVALATYVILQYDKRAQARFAFVRQIGVAIPANTPLFAAPDLDREDFIVLAYRLRRQIDQKPIYCAKRNDYFLTAVEPKPDWEARVLVSLDSGNTALVTALADGLPTATQNCQAPLSTAGNAEN